MNPFFCTQYRVEQLNRVALSWLNTPFHPNACVKGVGVSCHGLPVGVYLECGFLPVDYEMPKGDPHHSRHSRESIIEPIMDADERFQNFALGAAADSAARTSTRRPAAPVQLSDLIAGDMIGLRMLGCVHHCGVMVNNVDFVHTMYGHGVIQSSILDADWIWRVERAWRPVE